MHRPDLEHEISQLAAAARQRRSVDGFTRAAVEGLCWIVLTGICCKLVWDSRRLPLYFWPLVALDAFLLGDGVRSFVRARRDLEAELRVESRLRDLRRASGLDVLGADEPESGG